MHGITRGRTTWAAGAALALIAVACGSGSGSGGSTNVPGVTSSQITIGATVPLTGPAAPGYSEIAPAVDAVFAWQNAHGGVHGRKINYIYLDDGYNPSNTTTQTRKLVLQDNIFADVGSLGTPTQLAVQSYLNGQGVPQIFVESGCNCWSDSKYPDTMGWEPPYTVEGKLLGSYIAQHFAGEKIGYLYQGDEFGQDVVKGVSMEVPAASVVSQQTYDASTLAGPLATQMAALKAAGAQVVVLATIPAATALAMLPAAATGYFPQYVIDSVGSDAPTVGPLLASFAKSSSAAALLKGVITDAYLPLENDTSNPWIQFTDKVLQDYAPSLWAKSGLDGNTEYGVALGYTFVQALKAAGSNLTRQGLLQAIASQGHSFVTPGFVPLSYSSSVHFGYEGAEIVQLSTSAPAVTTPTGTWIGPTSLTPVETTSPGTGPVTNFSGSPSTPPPADVSSA